MWQRTQHNQGEVLEWLKRRAWKVRILQKGIAGSNPALSADSVAKSPNHYYTHKITHSLACFVRNFLKSLYNVPSPITK